MAGPLQLKQLKNGERILFAPSLLAADILNLQSAVDAVASVAEWLHIDVMDGHFVPNLSYGPALVKALREKYARAFLDVHIMAEPAEDFIEMFLEAKPSLLTIHLEAARHIHRALQTVKKSNVLAGVSINPGTSVSLLSPVLNMADVVLVMSVNPGYGGQTFIKETLDSVSFLAKTRDERGLGYLIEMDGGVSSGNIAACAAAGCDVAVAGSAVFKAKDPAAMVGVMRELANKG